MVGLASALSLVGAGIAAAGAAVGAAIGDGLVFGRAIEGMARQPEMRGTLVSQAFVLFAIVEALPVIALLVSFLILFGVVK